MTTPDLSKVTWRKASMGETANGCLEVAFLHDGRVSIRDNEAPDSAPFVVTAHVWRCFLDGTKKGEFDLSG